MGVCTGNDWEEMKGVTGKDLLRVLKSYVRGKPLLTVTTGKKGKVVKLYVKKKKKKKERSSSLGNKFVLSGLTTLLEHKGFETPALWNM